jgi:hypothetical protein
MKIFIVDALKFGAFFAGWTMVFGLTGLGAWIAATAVKARLAVKPKAD